MKLKKCEKILFLDSCKENLWESSCSINKGKIKNPCEDILTFKHIVEDVVHFNSTRIVAKSAVDVEITIKKNGAEISLVDFCNWKKS